MLELRATTYVDEELICPISSKGLPGQALAAQSLPKTVGTM